MNASLDQVCTVICLESCRRHSHNHPDVDPDVQALSIISDRRTIWRQDDKTATFLEEECVALHASCVIQQDLVRAYSGLQLLLSDASTGAEEALAAQNDWEAQREAAEQSFIRQKVRERPHYTRYT